MRLLAILCFAASMRTAISCSKARLGCCFALLHLASGCRTPAPFLQVDLNSPGWTAQTAQALWRPSRDQPEIVGDLVVARHEDGRAYLQFSKALPIVSARLHAQGWEAEFPPQNKRYAAPGSPPKRIVWLQLLALLNGRGVPPVWSAKAEGNPVTLENAKTGERLEVHF